LVHVRKLYYSTLRAAAQRSAKVIFRPPRRCFREADYRRRSLPNVNASPKMVHLETSESPALFAGLPGQLPLVTYFQGGARATVRTLCQTSAAWIPVRLKRDFLLAIRYVGNTARIFSDKSFAPANFSVRVPQQR
jgi:hypothetical protein